MGHPTRKGTQEPLCASSYEVYEQAHEDSQSGRSTSASIKHIAAAGGGDRPAALRLNRARGAGPTMARHQGCARAPAARCSSPACVVNHQPQGVKTDLCPQSTRVCAREREREERERGRAVHCVSAAGCAWCVSRDVWRGFAFGRLSDGGTMAPAEKCRKHGKNGTQRRYWVRVVRTMQWLDHRRHTHAP